ncbi:hypothetical protein CH373_03975 [Leptospira perolatii]|uniref:Thiol-disulfide oxidoreductase n=1 Tax=Leptospira perolatii TaxID=2023191 RepID=A0A2M9ZPT7_9LEPT|nr:DCC1-like thiol-disulfide oxidoreductase family protein [Leptospira perolatii]PJZ69039.1 hypothetical protein CH360_13355 [Leptospira perolatii]PJZ74092.1 hypothetical protein CH373_03975 [Leptospira perolatii]
MGAGPPKSKLEQVQVTVGAIDRPVVFFDGVCNFCNSSVNLLIALDRKSRFLFASLQSETAKKLVPGIAARLDGTEASMVLYDSGKLKLKSDAILGIGVLLGFPWSLARIGYIFPRFLRNSIYGWIARNRYKWFGKKEVCMIPDPKVKDRFLP